MKQLQCVGGPRAGAFFVLNSNDCRLPDGLWFNARDETGRNVQHQYYLDWGQSVQDGEVVIQYTYQGAVEACGDFLPLTPQPDTQK